MSPDCPSQSETAAVNDPPAAPVCVEGERHGRRRGQIAARNIPVALNVLWSRLVGRPPKYLPTMVLFVTNRCNLRCAMCGVWEHGRRVEKDSNGRREELSTDEWRDALRAAGRLKTSLVTLCGGEPLMRKDIFDIISFARGEGMSVHLCSNAVLLNPEDIGRLGTSGLNSISFSLDSPDRQMCDSLRGSGSYDSVIEAIRLIRERAPGIRVGINATITALNFRDMVRMVPFAEELGVDQVKFAPIHTNLLHKDKRWSEVEELLFKPEQLPEFRQEVSRLIEATSRSRLRTTSRKFLSGMPGLYEAGHRFRCFAGFAICAVDPYGMVSPCCDMDSTECVRDRPLDEIWRGGAFHALRRQVARCTSSCWDTTNTELSLRFRLLSLLGSAARTWRDMKFYFHEDNDDSEKESPHNSE